MPTVQVYAGNPNTHVAGAVQDFVWDSTHLVLWECTTTGNAAAAVWNGVSHKTLNNTLDNGSGVMILAGALTINGAAGTYREVLFDTASTLRWRVATNTAAESGSNAGSDFQVNAYSDAGSLLSTPLTITRSTGKITTGGGNTLDDGSGIVTGSGNVPAGVTGISGMMTVMLPAPVVLVSAITIDGANHTVNIGTAYPNAKIAILTIYGSVNPGSGSIDSLDISFAPSGTPGLSEFLMTVVGSPTAASWTNSQTIFVGLTPGSNPSFVYSASTTTGGSTGAIRLIGFIQ